MQHPFKRMCVIMSIVSSLAQASCKKSAPLSPAPDAVEQFSEIATRYNDQIPALFASLTPEERIMIYYLYRASISGNAITTEHIHRYGKKLMNALEFVLEHADTLRQSPWPEAPAFLDDVRTFLVYLWSNHGQYFMKEHEDEKRTPARIGLEHLDLAALKKAFALLGKAPEELDELAPAFDAAVESTLTVPGDIDASNVNFYSPDFTEADFAALSPDERTAINAYFSIAYDEHGARKPTMEVARVGGRYGSELAVSVHWLKKALAHAQKYPKQFDEHFAQSLEYLIQFLETGDEEWFKKHSIEWLKTNSKIDYCFGFIEVYEDPKSYRGSFQAEVTVKSVDMDTLNRSLPSLEKQLPLPKEFMRETIDDLSAIPNASINTQFFAAGHLGPAAITAAYCLPNYSEIRSEHGSKQIIYPAGKGLGELVNPDLYRELFYLSDQADWLAKYDRTFQLGKDVWTAHVILHETLGHGSGRLDYHVFKEGDPLTIENKTYKVGDRIRVTSNNINEFLDGYDSALEELRAEIIALYTSIAMFDELAAQGLYKEWPARIGKEKMIEQLIFDMAATGLRRIQSLQLGATKVTGAHARANMVIMNYLIDGGGLELVEENKIIDGTPYTVLGFRIADLAQTLADIKELLIRVQRIKSTGDTQDVQKLFAQYGDTVRNQEHIRIMRGNLEAVVGKLKVSSNIYPFFEPVHDECDDIVDVRARWPRDIFEQFSVYKKLGRSTQ